MVRLAAPGRTLADGLASYVRYALKRWRPDAVTRWQPPQGYRGPPAQPVQTRLKHAKFPDQHGHIY